MTSLGLYSELRDGNTIRAYLDELVLQKIPVQLWVTQEDALPFETTVAKVTRDSFTTAQTPPLQANQRINLSFTLDARRFTARTKVVAAGVFLVPYAIAQGERRARFRAAFSRADGIDAFTCEHVSPPFVWGRLVSGRLLDLSLQGLRMSLDDLSAAPDAPAPLKRGDAFKAVCIRGLPYTPAIQCAGVVAHVTPVAEGLSAGLLLSDLAEADQKNIERILARRFPTTFGAAFPRKHRKTDIADLPGAPVPVKEAVKPPEVVAVPVVAPPPPRERPPRAPATAVQRLRKASRRLLVIAAAEPGAQTLADRLREDDFRQVVEARSYLEAQNAARAFRFDLVLLDVKVGGHLGQMILETLRRHGFLTDTPVILVADRRDANIADVAEALGAVHVHEKRASYEELAPVLYELL